MSGKESFSENDEVVGSYDIPKELSKSVAKTVLLAAIE